MMMLRHLRHIAMVGMCLCLMLVQGFNCDRTGTGSTNGGPRTAIGQGPDLVPPEDPIFLSESVPYCWEKPLFADSASIQVLFDASGSMVGFQHLHTRLVEWLKRGISQLDGATITRTEYRLGQFAQGSGIFKTTGWNEAAAAYRPRSNTNLHEALATAADYDLTFVLTDGVAAAGVAGSGDCPGGVDAACVAQVLRNVVHAEAPDGRVAQRGLWMIPLVAEYNGRFYTEELLDLSSFDSQETVEQVQAEVGGSVAVVNPQADRQGRLIFSYKGPRALLLIVTASEVSIGRAAVYALNENARFSGIDRVRNLKGYAGGLNMLQPIEVYPGYVGNVDWTGFARVDDPNLHQGTMDVSGRTGANTSLNLTCFGEEQAWGVYDLRGRPSVSGGAGCLDLAVLPGLRFRLEHGSGGEAGALAQVLKGYELIDESGYAGLRLKLACPAPLGGDALTVQWVSYMEYGPAANCLADSGCDYLPHRTVRALSTARPSLEPHRIYGFDALLTNFYREVSDDQRRAVLADLVLTGNASAGTSQ